MARICVVQPSLNIVSETFIRAHGERLPGVAGIIHRQDGVLASGGRPILSQTWPARAARKLGRLVTGRPWEWEINSAYRAAFRRCSADVVLAEYGMTGIDVVAACELANVPLVVHFHGYDASRREILERYGAAYRRLFQVAAAVIVVSRAMEVQLLALGCPREKLIYNPYGIDCGKFCGAAPRTANKIFVAVGRLVDKKAPHLTLLAFASVHREIPDARLRMIGDGPLRGVCRDLAQALGIESAVAFLGAQPHEVVQREMQQARAFVQHSVVALDGDSEGTPVAVLEAGAMGLPVIATRHAGIPDVVIDQVTGLLVDERDVAGMGERMLTLAHNPALAGELGEKAAAHVRKHYTMEQSLNRLSRVLEGAAENGDLQQVRAKSEADLCSDRFEVQAST